MKAKTKQAVRIVPSLQPLAVAVDSLHHDPANARRHDERNVEAIKSSFSQFGQRIPLVVQREGMIVRAGNGRLEAARQLGWTEVAAVVVDEDNVSATAFAIADNRTAELADWDLESLSGSLSALREEEFDLGLLGWDEHELKPLFDADWDAAQDLGGGGFEGVELSGASNDFVVLKFARDARVTMTRFFEEWKATGGHGDSNEGIVLSLVEEWRRNA